MTGQIKPGAKVTTIDTNVKVRYDVRLGFKAAVSLIKRADEKFQYQADLAWEGFRIGCYRTASFDRIDDMRAGHFAYHKDNDSPLTKVRQYGFVAAINHAHDYRGGDLHFPEIGVTCRLPAGTAILFDAGLLHGVSPIVSGRRLVLISFLYQADDEETSE